MKYLLFAVALLFSLMSKAQASMPQIVATIKPVHSLVAGVMGDTGEPALLVDGITSPHGYALKPSQRKLLNEANLVFLIDPHFESFLAKVLHDLPGHVRAVKLAQAGGVTVLDHRAGGVWEAHVHSAHTHATQEDLSHHEHAHEPMEHDESHSDRHLWLDPQNAIVLTKAIAKELGKVYPEHRSIYKKNAKAQIASLTALDAQLAVTLFPLKSKPFIVFHDAYQYLERRYGLTAVGSITLEPEQKVSAKRIKAIRQKLTDSQAVCVFREPQFDDKLINTVIEGTTVKSGTLDPIGADIKAGAGLYAAMLQNLAKDLTTCLN